MDGALVSSSLFTSPLHIDQIGNCANTSDFWIMEIRCWSCRRSAELLRHHAARSLHLPLTERQLLLYLPCWTRGDDALMPVDPLNRNTALQANGVSPCVLNETPVQQRAPNGLPLVASQHGVARFNALPSVGGKVEHQLLDARVRRRADPPRGGGAAGRGDELRAGGQGGVGDHRGAHGGSHHKHSRPSARRSPRSGWRGSR